MFAGCRYAVMTTAAISNDADMIEVGRYPPVAGMAVITGISAGYVCWMLARRGNTIMAGSTGADDLGVIDHQYWRERDDAVAILANRRGLNVGRVFADCVRAVMTAHTVASDIDVIEIGWRPCDGGMAVVARFATRYVCRRLARRNIAIVTRLAGADDLRVIDHARRRPKIDTMAVLAHGCGLNVRYVLAGCICAVVAA